MYKAGWLTGIVLLAMTTMDGQAAELELLRVDKISTISQHNAFTDLIHYKDHFYCTWREASSHTSDDGKFRVVRSADGTNWTSVALFTYPGSDHRDTHFSVTADNRLMVNGTVRHPTGSPVYQNMAWFTEDGTNWTDSVLIGEDDLRFWKTEWRDGVGYGVGFSGSGAYPEMPRFSRLYTSTDATNWNVHVPQLYSSGFPNELAIIFMQDDTAHILQRRDIEATSPLLGTAHPPAYTNWTWQNLGTRIGGPELICMPDNRLLAGVRLYSPDKTWLCWIDPDTGTLSPALQLPSGGDTSYCGMIWQDGRLWVSYYRGDNGDVWGSPTSVYIAEVAYNPQQTQGIIAQHQGANHPVNDEGWTADNGGGGSVSAGPISSDSIGGLDAWNVTDSSSALNTRLAYKQLFSSQVQQNAATNTWTLRMRLRVVNSNDALDLAMLGALRFNTAGFTKRFQYGFGSDASGNMIVGRWNGSGFAETTTATGNGYHLFELVYDPDAGSADLFMDGVEAISNDVGFNNTSAEGSIIWGSNQSAGIGNANYNLVEFIVGTEENPDADGDGIPDDWENQYGGTNLFFTGGDWDGDGLDDDEEQIAGTNPTNGASTFTILSVSNMPSATLVFPGVSGRTYRAHWSTNLLGTNWWLLAGTSVTVDVNGEVQITDTNPPTPQRFYRLTVE